LTSDQRITLMSLLGEAHAHLSHVLGAELERAYGLPLSWFEAMVQLRRSPDGQLTMNRLGAEVALTSGGITRLVDRLVDAGYAERRGCPTDRRSVYVALTPAGVDILEKATGQYLEGLDRHLLGPLDLADRAALTTALEKLRG
jgi:MarR family 2-MHQ and catechol resistance regulon transcriptional repressor